MVWLPPQGQPGIIHRSRPTTGSPSRSSSTNMARGAGRKQDGQHPSNILLEGKPATAANAESSVRQGGKRPRTTSSIFAAAATGMLTGRVAPTVEATTPSYAGRREQQPGALFRLRGHMASGRVDASAASNSLAGPDMKRVSSPAGTAVAYASITTTTVLQSNAADAMILDESRYSEDALGEAAAMAADERRSSPPAPLPGRALGYPRHALRKQQATSPHPTLIDDAPERALSQAMPFNSRTPKHSDDYPAETEAMHSRSLYFDPYDRRSLSPSAPAYEPSPSNEGVSSWRYTPERHLEEASRSSREITQQQQQQQHVAVGARAKGGDLELAEADGFGSITQRPSPQRQQVERDVQMEVEGGRRRHTRSPLQQVPAIPNLEGKQPPSSPTISRQDLISTLKRSDDAYQSVREDLRHYMEGVRARTSEDGTPSVTFPKNFDRIVGLMGRSELEDRSPGEEVKDSNRSGGVRSSPEGGGKGGGKGQAKGAAPGDRPPPWTKYLLEEGLDRTKAFSRYKGMFADEQTGEDRVMRGLAKMRELDLRLARTTGRARELKIMALQAAEQAERAAVGVSTESKRTSPRHGKGLGPVVVEDVTTNHRRRLTLPLSSEPAPFGAISSRVSNGSARQTESTGGGGTALRTERSGMSAASGSQPDTDGPGGGSRDGHARDGRAFVTQSFRGAGRKGSSSRTGSASVSVDGSEKLASTPTPSGVPRRWKHKLGGPEDSASSGRASSGGEGGGCASSNASGYGGSGGSSGVSFVLRNKRHAARASRRRLTDEQENLVSRLLHDADGFNEEGEPTGEQPSGVWAEIVPYGGAGARDDAARLAEINAKLLAIGGVLPPDCAEELEEQSNAVQDTPTLKEGEQKLPRPTAPESKRTGAQNADEKGRKSSSPPPPPPPSRSRRISGSAAAARDATVPREAALREQRERREARYKERAIDNALEQLRDSLFQNSAAGGRNVREEAVDTALELARSAPLDMQGGIRQGAGRIDSLLGGEGPQPVGEWEVKHALRQGKEELRGKGLASQDKIEELLVTVRQQSAADSKCASHRQQRDDTVGSEDFPKGATLDAVFSLAGTASSNAQDGEVNILSGTSEPSASINDATATADDSSPSPPCSKNRRETMEAAGTERKQSQQADKEAPLADGSRSADRARPPRRKATETTKTASSTTAAAEGPSPAPRPRPRLPRKKEPASSVVPPELTSLFRAPLLVPRHLDPPVAGIAAAAVAAGGASRVLPPGPRVASNR